MTTAQQTVARRSGDVRHLDLPPQKPDEYARPAFVTAVIIISGSILSTLIPMAIVPAMPAMSKSIAAGANGTLFAQLVTTLPAVAMALFSPLAGKAVSLFGFRRYFLISLALFVVAGTAGLYARTLPELVVSRLLLGVAGGGVAPLPFALAGNFAPAIRDRLIGFAGSAGGISAILALNIGGGLVDEWGWRAPFALYIIALFVMVAAWIDRTTPSDPAPKPSSGSVRSILHLYGLLLLLSIGFNVPTLAGPFMMAANGINSASSQGLLLSIFSFCSIISASAFGFAMRYSSTMSVAALAAILMAMGMATMAMASGEMMMELSLAITGLGAGLAAPAIISEILSRAAPEARAKAMGLKVTAIFLAQFVTPLVLHPAQTRFGLPVAVLCMSVLLLLTALWAVMLRPRHHL